MSDSESYASEIVAEITTSSSIPDKDSISSTQVQADNGKVFRGSPASILHFNMIPSKYKSVELIDDEYGYHTVITDLPEPGATSFTNDVLFTSDFLVTLEISRSENVFMTTIEKKETLLLLIITLLGSIFGAMEALGSIMHSIEEKTQWYRERKIKRKAEKALKEKGHLLSVFTDNPEFPDHKRIEEYEFPAPDRLAIMK